MAGWCVWLAAQTQWRYASTPRGAIPTGLDYTALVALLRAYGYRHAAAPDRPALQTILDDVRACESAALSEFTRARERAGA